MPDEHAIDVESRLREELDAVADAVTPSSALDEAVFARTSARLRRRRAVLAAAAAVAVVALVGGALALRDGEPDRVEVVEGPDDGAGPAPGTWAVTAPAPIAARHGHVTAWTGEELLVWGGAAGVEVFGDGAAYDPESDTWRTLAPAPIGARQDAVSVWTGDEWVIVGGEVDGQRQFDLAAYDPETDSWRSTDFLHASAGATAAVWTGAEVVLVGVHGGPAADLVSDVVAVDPETLAMRTLPAVPGSAFSAVADGSEVLVTSDGQDCATRCVWRLDPESDSVELLAEAGGPVGQLVLQDGLLVGNGGSWSLADGSAGPATPATDAAVANPVAAGAWIVGATWEQGQGPGGEPRWWQHRVADGRTVDLPAPPDERPRYDAQAVWTGTDVLVWGGTHCSPDTDCGFTGPLTGLRLVPADGSTDPTATTTTTSQVTTTTEVATTTNEASTTTVTTQPEAQGTQLLAAGTTFGMCLDLCVFELTFDEGGGLVSVARGHAGSSSTVAPVQSRGHLTAAGRQQLEAALAGLVVGDPEVVVGCPDCTDGGAAWVLLADGSRQSQVTYEFGGPPAELSALDAVTMAVWNAFRSCTPDDLVALDHCTPALP